MDAYRTRFKPVSFRRRYNAGEPAGSGNIPARYFLRGRTLTSSRGATRWRAPTSWRKAHCASTTRARTDAEGTLYWVEPGQTCILALNSTFSRLAYPAWVESDGPTRFAIVPGQTYRELFAADPAVQRFTFETLSGGSLS